MMDRTRRITVFVFLLFLVGCSSLAPLLSTPTPASVPQATSTPAPSLPTPTATLAPRLLRVWLPPRFDPNSNTSSAQLLKQRFDEFELLHPGLEIEVRIKAEEGETGLLNALSITNAAAPAALPDLIALSHSNMDLAAEMGLLHPIDGLTTLLQDPDWYAYARQLALADNTAYGIPFAGDALVLVYRPAVFREVPSGWRSIFESGNPLVYPPSDPRALFSISLYLSMNGTFTDNEGQFHLDQDALTRVLSFHQTALKMGNVPFSIREFQSDQHALQMFREGTAGAAVIRASSDLKTGSGAYLPLFGLNDEPFTLAEGWVWALAGSDRENEMLAAELASYLVESEFMSAWTREAGYLPTRPTALNGWGDALKIPMNEVLSSARVFPPEEILSVAGPILREAVIRVYNGEQAEAVARSVIENLK
ncbi:MAG TPA: extracellular solute-binding protein [Anaerolineales bacterium]|nr:extracellular solute-binding protein [Anaerolineales bacterium]